MSGVRKVLLVDDEAVQQTLLRSVLATHGFEVISAISGEEGLLAAEQEKPDIIVLDVMMPGIKGRDVCKRLKAQESTRNIPVLFLTAKDSADDLEAETAAGAAGHLTKPINSMALIRQLKTILG